VALGRACCPVICLTIFFQTERRSGSDKLETEVTDAPSTTLTLNFLRFAAAAATIFRAPTMTCNPGVVFLGIATPGGHSKKGKENKESTRNGGSMHRRSSSSPRLQNALSSRPRHRSNGYQFMHCSHYTIYQVLPVPFTLNTH
jgi:hypothetical protein